LLPFSRFQTLGSGFVARVYQRALPRGELELRGIQAIGQAVLSISYKGQHVGDYGADLVIEDVLIVELKWVERLANVHTAQCLNLFELRPENLWVTGPQASG
jgi:GxxExxY protein